MNKDYPYDAVVIGGSAGALDGLSLILPGLPKTYSLPIMVVVHIPPEKESIIPALFKTKSQIDVMETEDKQEIKPGTVYFAPPDYHLLIENNKTLSLSNDEPVLFSRPSIDVLFESAADVYGSRLLGIILSGANSDGAAGLAAIIKAGGTGLVQNPEQAIVPDMPREALKACPDATSLDLESILLYLKKVSISV